MYPRRPGSARYAPRWSRACRSSSLCSRSASYSVHLSSSTPGAAFSLSSKNASRSSRTVIWWKSEVNFSFFLCLATFRMRSSACDTLSRSCAQYVLCWPVFPLASTLRSTDSAADCSALFVGFPANMAESDFPHCHWSCVGSPGSRATSVCTCQFLRRHRAVRALALTCPYCCLLPSQRCRRPGYESL